jgi:hypothetical protein
VQSTVVFGAWIVIFVEIIKTMYIVLITNKNKLVQPCPGTFHVPNQMQRSSNNECGTVVYLKHDVSTLSYLDMLIMINMILIMTVAFNTSILGFLLL